MPMSDYVRALRAKIGTTVLEVPTVSILTFDAARRVLLVRQVDSDLWTTPGGMIEPYERPADAAVREMWEETGIAVELTHIVGVFGGAEHATTYANGDRIAWVSTVFGARPLRGTPRPDGEEVAELRYVDPAALHTLARRPHVDRYVEAACAWTSRALFEPPAWQPPE